jgi:hypothetical protein
LDKLTRTDAASDFMGIHKVPKYAITMGIQTILGKFFFNLDKKNFFFFFFYLLEKKKF